MNYCKVTPPYNFHYIFYHSHCPYPFYLQGFAVAVSAFSNTY